MRLMGGMSGTFFQLLAAAFVVSVLSVAAAQEEGRRVINVSSDRAEYAADNKSVLFSGNVVMQAEGLSVRAVSLQVEKDAAGNRYVARGAPVMMYCDDCASVVLRAEAGDEMRYNVAADRLQMEGGVHVCADDNCALGELHAETADWERSDGALLLRGELVRARWQPADEADAIIAEAREIRYDLVSGDVVLEGDALIKRGDGEVRGNAININVKTGALAAEAAPKERVRATF